MLQYRLGPLSAGKREEVKSDAMLTPNLSLSLTSDSKYIVLYVLKRAQMGSMQCEPLNLHRMYNDARKLGTRFMKQLFKGLHRHSEVGVKLFSVCRPVASGGSSPNFGSV